MAQHANVKSSDSIETARAVLLFFAKQSEEGLTELGIEMRRMVEWFQHDRPAFWTEQVRLAYDGVGKAKADLHRCLMFPVGVNERPSCSEERAALKKAQARLAYCEEKREKLKHWIRELNHEMHTYEGRTARFKEVVEADVPNAAAALSRLLLQLEEYANLSSSSGPPPGPTAKSESAESSEPGTKKDADAETEGHTAPEAADP